MYWLLEKSVATAAAVYQEQVLSYKVMSSLMKPHVGWPLSRSKILWIIVLAFCLHAVSWRTFTATAYLSSGEVMRIWMVVKS